MHGSRGLSMLPAVGHKTITMDNDQILLKKQYYHLLDRVEKKSRTCMSPYCSKKAINSHVLQKSRYINRIAQNGHVYEHKVKRYGNREFEFSKVGINDVFTFKGFCAHHDNYIFKEIENDNVDLFDRKVNLLFAYRIICQEIVKKENKIIFYNELINNRLIDIEYYNWNIGGLKSGVRDCEYIKNKLHNNINNAYLDEFGFYFREVSISDICASGVYTYETSQEINNLSKFRTTFHLTEIFLNILPFKNKSFVSFVFFKDNNIECNAYLKSIFELSDDEFVKYLSDVLLVQMENWIISSDLYNKIKDKESILNDITIEALTSDNERFSPRFNLFKV